MGGDFREVIEEFFASPSANFLAPPSRIKFLVKLVEGMVMTKRGRQTGRKPHLTVEMVPFNFKPRDKSSAPSSSRIYPPVSGTSKLSFRVTRNVSIESRLTQEL
jgi:hypothetical protein